MDENEETGKPRRYTWPWFVLGAVVLWLLLAIIWMTVLVRRTRDQRDYTPWPAPTQPIPKTNAPPLAVNVDPAKARRD